MATPYLPQYDPDPAQRQARLAAARERHVPDAEALPPFVVDRAPSGDEDEPGSLGERLSSSLGRSANLVAVKLAGLLDRFDELQDYEDVFRLYETPQIVQRWRLDAAFSEQRVAGVEPRLLRRADRLPADLRVPGEPFTALTGLSLDRAAGEGRLYVVDHAPLADVAVGADRGRQKFLHAPISLFCWLDEPGSEDMFRGTARRGRLAPVAIQLDQRPGHLYTPRDGVDWLLARTAVQSADYTLSMLGHHLALGHLALGSVALVTARQLADNHPLAALLRPHLRGATSRADLTRRSLLAPGGAIERLFAPTHTAALEICADTFKKWDLAGWALPVDLAARGVDDPEVLPHYPYRDDGLLIWRAISDLVRDLLGVCYDSDGDMQADVELRAWLAELAGAVPGVPAWPIARAALAELVTTIIFTSGPDHSARIGRQREYATFAPNMPMALYSPFPARGAAESALLELLPPQRQALGQLELIELLTASEADRLGQYGGEDHFLTEPERSQEVVTAFQERLACIEGDLERRNEHRDFPYHGMVPSKLANSAGA